MILKKYFLTVKMFLVGFLILLLFIPLRMISSLVDERQLRRIEAGHTVEESWGGIQTVGAPILVVPYVTEIETPQWNTKTPKPVKKVTHYAFFLPEVATIDGQIKPEIRNLGLFHALLYSTDLKISGQFNKPDFTKLNIKENNINWDKSFIIFSVNDNLSIKDAPNLNFNSQNYELIPSKFYFKNGLSTSVDLSSFASQQIDFVLDVKLNGHEELRFISNAKTFSVNLQSTWANPNFSGFILPNTRKISSEGFQATWQTTYLNRDYPQVWQTYTSEANNEYFDINPSILTQSTFQVRLANPVDAYQITTRSIKYGYLFVLLTLSGFFIFEILCRQRLHPIQYFFVGFTICIFFLLLLALSEHLAFGLAYFLASSAVTLLIGFYSVWVFSEPRWGYWIGIFTGALYAYLYVLLQAEDFALLLGSLGLFFMLAISMIFTRRVQWYALEQGETS